MLDYFEKHVKCLLWFAYFKIGALYLLEYFFIYYSILNSVIVDIFGSIKIPRLSSGERAKIEKWLYDYDRKYKNNVSFKRVRVLEMPYKRAGTKILFRGRRATNPIRRN